MSDAGAARDDRYIVPALARAVAMLRLFSTERRTMTAADMARALAVPRSTVFRLAQTLTHLGLLEKTDGGHAYRLGLGILGLGFEYLAALDLTEVGRRYLDALRDETGLSCHLVIRDGQKVIVVLKAGGHSAFSGSLDIGAALPAHGTVLGRVILADLEASELRALYPDEPLESHSPQTPTTVDALAALLAADRARGYAVSDSFFEAGISAVAAPVRDGSGRVIAAINVTVPGNAPIGKDLIGSVRETAAGISRALRYQPLDEAANGRGESLVHHG